MMQDDSNDRAMYRQLKARGNATGDWIPQPNDLSNAPEPRFQRSHVGKAAAPPQMHQRTQEEDNTAAYNTYRTRGNATSDWMPTGDDNRAPAPQHASTGRHVQQRHQQHGGATEEEVNNAAYKSYRERGNSTSDWIPTNDNRAPAPQHASTGRYGSSQSHNAPPAPQPMHRQESEEEVNTAAYNTYRQRGNSTSDWLPTNDNKAPAPQHANTGRYGSGSDIASQRMGSGGSSQYTAASMHQQQQQQDDTFAQYKAHKARGQSTGDWIPQAEAQAQQPPRATRGHQQPSSVVSHHQDASMMDQQQHLTQYRVNKQRGHATGDWIPAQSNAPQQQQHAPPPASHHAPPPAPSSVFSNDDSAMSQHRRRKPQRGAQGGTYNILTGASQ